MTPQPMTELRDRIAADECVWTSWLALTVVYLLTVILTTGPVA